MQTKEQSDVNRAINATAYSFINEVICAEDGSLNQAIDMIVHFSGRPEASIRSILLERIGDYILGLSSDGQNWRKIEA
jgi:hypothetical protein